MKAPPLLPEEAFYRTVRVANIDGICVMAIAGMLALAAASGGDWVGAGIGLAVAAAGAIELHGVGLLRAGHARGMNWLIASQPYLCAVLLGYCGWRLSAPDLSALKMAMTSQLREQIAATGWGEDEFLRFAYVLTYTAVGIGTLIYQGGMTLYFLRRRAAVTEAVGADEAGEEETDEA